MKLTSLKNTKADLAKQKKGMEPSTGVNEMDAYPWGTQLRLEREVLSKMPDDVAELEVGTEVTIQARGKVIEKRSEDRAGGNPRRSLEIQLTAIGVQNMDDFAAGFEEG